MSSRTILCALGGSGLVIWLSMGGASRPPGQLRAVGGGVVKCVGKTISADGSAMAILGRSADSGVDALLVCDVRTGQTADVARLLPRGVLVAPLSPSISGDGRFVAFMMVDENRGLSFGRIVVFDRNERSVEFVLSDSDTPIAHCSYSDSAFSQDGSVLVFTGVPRRDDPLQPPGVYDLFIWDRRSGLTERIVAGPDGHSDAAMATVSGDGRLVAFLSRAGLAPEDTNGSDDVYVHDRETRHTEWASVAAGGTPGDGPCLGASISPCGRYVAFSSRASNLVPDDTNDAWDVFVYDRRARTTRRVSVASGGIQTNASSFGPSLCAGGRYVAFDSDATNLAPGAKEGVRNVYVHDCTANSTMVVSSTRFGRCGDGPSLCPTMTSTGAAVLFVSRASNLISPLYDASDGPRVLLWQRIDVGSEGIFDFGFAPP